MKKFVIGILVLLLLLVAAALAAPFMIPTDTYKAKLIAAVKESTGRELKIDGPISFSLLPQIALSAQDVSFANAPGGIARNMVQLKSMALKLKLLPLLAGSIEIDSLVLVDPAIALEIDKQGRANWDFSRPETAQSAPAPSSGGDNKGGGLSALSSLHLGEIRLQNGEVSYADQRSEKRWDASAINATLSMADLDSPLAAQGSATWNDEQINLVVAIAKPSAFAGGNATDISVKLASNPFNLDFAGSGAGGPEMKLSGTVDLAVPSVRGFVKWAGTPITMAGSGLGPLSIKGKVEVAGDTYAFSDAEIALDAIKAKGAVSVDTSHEKPYAKGNLDVETLDLNPYLAPEGAASQAGAAPAGGSAGGGAGTPAQKGWSTEPMDLSALKLADADFDLSAQAIRFHQISIDKSALTIHLKDGVLTIDLSDIELYQGKGQGKVTIDGAVAVPAVAESFALKGVDVQPLLRDAANVSLLSGTGSLDMSVAGHGKSQHDIIAGLTGKGSLAIDKGALKGVDMVAMVKNAASTLTAGAIGGSSQTDFSTLTATYTVTNGILKNSDLKMDSPGLPMTGAGTVDLLQRRVDYKLTPKLVGALAVPVNITGPWDDLSYRPDLAGVVSQSGKSLQNILKNPPNINTLKSLFGGGKNQ